MYIVIIIMAILFVISYPQIGVSIIALILIGALFNKWAKKFYKNLFLVSWFAWAIIDEFKKKYFVFDKIDKFIKYICEVTKLNSFYKNEDIRYFIVLGILLTLSDISITKLINYFRNAYPEPSQQINDSEDTTNARAIKQNVKKKQTKINNNQANEEEENINFGVYDSKASKM